MSIHSQVYARSRSEQVLNLDDLDAHSVHYFCNGPLLYFTGCFSKPVPLDTHAGMLKRRPCTINEVARLSFFALRVSMPGKTTTYLFILYTQ
jgi:hypothetical protein